MGLTMSRYLRYILENTEPIRIADDATSQSGQTMSLRYIPGTTIRGLIVNALSKDTDFETIKKKLFGKEVRFLNGYPVVETKELIPSPKGFYEDKVSAEGKKEIKNVVINGDFPEGYKRAALGRYCYIQEDCIHYYNVETGSDMKIKMNLTGQEKQNVFRNEYIAPGQVFVGYLAVEDESLAKRIEEVLTGTIRLGSGRSAGLGKCRVLDCCVTEKVPYQEYLPQKGQENVCYMMLLSNTVMRDEMGELCGLNLKALEKQLGVNDLSIEYCSTSTVDVKGYNRIWGTKIPSVMMYEQGSVFRLKYSGVLTTEKMRELANIGLGIRKNEGFGRILFLDQYEAVKYKLAGEAQKKAEVSEIEKKPEDEAVLKLAAKAHYRNLIHEAMKRYIVKCPLNKGSISDSQLGMIESLASAYRYDPQNAERVIRDYLEHAGEKEQKQNVQKASGSFKNITSFILYMFDTDIEELLEMDGKKEVMGISKKELLSAQEQGRLKLQLLVDLIRYYNKKGEK